MRRKLGSLLIETVCYGIIVTLLFLAASKLGWLESSPWEDAIASTIGWILWRGFVALWDRRKKRK